jgi:tetratricopeptide (TPR) repeat protein
VLLAGGYIVRSFAAETLWPSSPEALGASIMAEVGAAAGRGADPNAETMAKLQRLAAEQPLSWEPFLVQGAIALRKGNVIRAEHLITSARNRAPRSPAARYLLADVYLRTGRPLQAMTEMAVLNRLVPAASVQLAPSLANYARTPGSVPQIRQILESYPELEAPLLAKLSWDPNNADLIMTLASAKRTAGPAPDWQRLMLTTLVNNGQYEKAYTLWRKLAGLKGLPSGFYDPGFAEISAPPPFNWQLAQGAGGVAERSSGSLQVLYFGRDNAELASQVLLLPPGRYRLAMNVSGDIASSNGVSWTVICLPSQRVELKLPAKAGAISAEFVVPSGECPAQRVTLGAEAPEIPDGADFRISGLQLTSLRP